MKQMLVAAMMAAIVLAPVASHAAPPAKARSESKGPVKVVLTTSLGVIELELDREKAPISVENFITYARAGHYNKTIFHRVIPGFMVQGGGMEASMKEKPTRAPIKNESIGGLANQRGTVAMARTSDPDSATSQFFINVVDNAYLDGKPGKPGYTVFGRVTKGMEVVDKIAAVPTGRSAGMKDVPTTPVIIESVVIK